MSAPAALAKKMPITTSFPELGTGAIDVEPYISEKLFELERERIFKRLWLKVGRIEEMPSPGDYKVKRIPTVKTSVILVRGEDNTVRAFHNSCTHRGNKLIEADEEEAFGSARTHLLACRFHSWTFRTDGTFHAAPKFERFDLEDKSCLALKRIHCDIWQGFIFVNFSATPAEGLREYLGGIDTHYGAYPYGEATLAMRYTTILKCNWKVAMDAFTESYHVPTIHAATTPTLTRVDQTDFHMFGPHCSSGIYVHGMETSKQTPATRKFGDLLHRSSRHRSHMEKLPASINPARRQDFQMDFAVVFPNFILHVQAGNGFAGMTHFTHQFWPIEVGTTFWEGTNYFRQAERPSERVAIAHVNAMHRNGWLEDTSNMERVHESLCSRALDKLYFMDEEAMLRNSAAHWRKYMGYV